MIYLRRIRYAAGIVAIFTFWGALAIAETLVGQYDKELGR
jgi:hypothetical protein